MTWRVDRKSVALGAVLGVGLSVLVGAARNEPAGPVDRYRVSCSQNTAYLVDTVTGQVWLSSEREFRTPKLRTESTSETQATATTPTRTPTVESPRTEPRPGIRMASFIGKWVLTHPTQGQFAIQIERDGRAILSQGNQSSEGKWQLDGDHITITTDRESMTAQVDDQGRLQVKEAGGEPIAFQRAQE